MHPMDWQQQQASSSSPKSSHPPHSPPHQTQPKTTALSENNPTPISADLSPTYSPIQTTPLADQPEKSNQASLPLPHSSPRDMVPRNHSPWRMYIRRGGGLYFRTACLLF